MSRVPAFITFRIRIITRIAGRIGHTGIRRTGILHIGTRAIATRTPRAHGILGHRFRLVSRITGEIAMTTSTVASTTRAMARARKTQRAASNRLRAAVRVEAARRLAPAPILQTR
jgi:hypothetical protein